MNKKVKKNFEYNDEYCDECGCGVECEDPLEHEVEDLEFHNVNKESIMHLTLEDDREIDALVLGYFEVDEKEYVALLPEQEEDVLVYEYIELENEAFDLKYIEDQEEFDNVSEAFYTLFSDEEIGEIEVHLTEEKFVEYDDYKELED
ncbi:MAG TPA: DUF1292 domain-containing protein [Tissierellaceae bacterium]|nr:DUF1292 domain-containing protein [Tissierellaceae bacterium]